MLGLKTYRSRLVTYIALLMVFLVATLMYSYWTTRSALLQEAQQNLDRTVRLLTGQLESTKTELQRYARIVRDDLRLQEYMFIVVRVSKEIEPLENLFKQQFGWLPISRMTLLDNSGKYLMGDRQETFLKKIRQKIASSVERTFTFQIDHDLELVTLAPISYRGDVLGHVAISHTFNDKRLDILRKKSGGELFIVEKGQIITSTLDRQKGSPFRLEEKHVLLNEEFYRVLEVDLPDMEPHTPQLWFGVSEKELTDNLRTHIQTTLIMIIIGGTLILVVGIAIVRDFSQPLVSLMSMTAKIAAGELPNMGKTVARNEIECLANQFADMLQGLREKQQEIDRAHEQLEELAITDTLTGLYNRRYLQDTFPKLKAQVERDNKILGVILCDLDHFKRINDEYGHLCGDFCLKHFGWILKKYSRENDYVFRMGGEEFLILCINDDIPSVVALAEKIRTAVQNDRINFDDNEIMLTISCGVTTDDGKEGKDLNILLSEADTVMYKAKKKGRNQVNLWSGKKMVQKVRPA